MQDEKCQNIFSKYQRENGTVFTMLRALQHDFGYIPEKAVFWLADKTNIPVSRFYGAATYFKQFRLKPRGVHTVAVCCGTACHVRGAATITGRIRSDLSLAIGDDTTDNGHFTIETISCAGVCDEAPVIIVDDKVYGGVNPDSTMKILGNIN